MAANPPPLHAHDRDALTGLVGAAGVRERIGEWQARAGKHEVAPVHALMLALQRFDTVNLAYGAAAGDSALAAVAARIQTFAADAIEGEWAVARIGGGNFLLAANEPCSRERWQWLAETLAEVVAQPIANPAGEGTLRLWPRIALIRPVPGENADAMFGRLAETLERMRQGAARRLLWVDGELSVTGRHGAQLEADLLAALDRDEIEILYQPQFSTTGDVLVGAEALARWQHPQLGRIGAGALFAIAERAEHVAQLSRHIATHALAGAAQWREGLRLSLNVTPTDLVSGGFAGEMAAGIAEAGFAPERLTLEITEQALLSDVAGAAKRLGELVEQGVRIALDDFGAGFCNFRYLKLLPLHYLKLDRTMVEGIVEDERDLAVLRAITAMAQALGLEVIAEGIESEAQRDLAAREGCAYYQGFLKARPMAAREFLEFAGGKSPSPV